MLVCPLFVQPGYICEVEIKVEVMKSAAGLLNSGAETIEDILVLHLDGGKDFFVSFLCLILDKSI